MLFQEFWKNWGKAVNADGSRVIETIGTMTLEDFLQNKQSVRYEDLDNWYLKICVGETSWKVFQLNKHTKEVSQKEN